MPISKFNCKNELCSNISRKNKTHPKDAESSSEGTEWGSSALGKRALQI